MTLGRVLVVDDHSLAAFALKAYLAQLGYIPTVAPNGWEALKKLNSEPFDLLILDLQMPEMDGHEVLRLLRQTPEFHRLPIVVMSSHEEIDIIAGCIESGADDFIIKPFNPTLLKARLHALMEKKQFMDAESRHMAQLMELREELERTNHALRDANCTLQTFAFTDTLTGLPNRRSAVENLDRCWELFLRSKRTFSCLMVDIDRFKWFNDKFGHDCGDHVLREVARHIKDSVRACDLVCRFGGEEFLVVCPDTDLAGALLVGERVRQLLAAQPVVHQGHGHAVTASIGVAQTLDFMDRPESLLKCADEALYQAKEQGRDRVVAMAQSSPAR